MNGISNDNGTGITGAIFSAMQILVLVLQNDSDDYFCHLFFFFYYEVKCFMFVKRRNGIEGIK